VQQVGGPETEARADVETSSEVVLRVACELLTTTVKPMTSRASSILIGTAYAFIIGLLGKTWIADC